MRPNGEDIALTDAAVDRVLAFHVPARSARGRLVRLGPTLDTILAAHAYPPPLARLLGEALVLTALLGSVLPGDEGTLTLQAQARGGVVDLIVCDWRGGALRGYLRHDPERLAQLGAAPSLKALLGTGHLAITLDQPASAERYQGIVPLEGGSFAEIAQSYFAQSEQMPTFVRIATENGLGGGLIVQHLPRGELGGPRLHVAGEHPDWSHVRALAATVREGELVDPDLALDALLWRLFHEDEVRIQPLEAVEQGCRCSPEHIGRVLTRFSREELETMREPDGRIHVDCAFCAKSFAIEIGGVA